MDTHERLVVVGGGIFGVAAAYALARAGYGHVVLVERQRLGLGSTGRSAGILSLQTWNDLDAQLIHRTRQLLVELVAWGESQAVANAAQAWRPVTAISVAERARRPALVDIHERLVRMGESAEILGAADAIVRFPLLRFQEGESVVVGSGEGRMDPAVAVELAWRRARQLGARFREGMEVSRLLVDGGRVTGVAYRKGLSERCDRVIVAGGSWTRKLLQESGVTLPAVPYRTQLALFDMAGADALPIVHDTVNHFYARPDVPHRFLAGDGTQLRAFDPDDFDLNADPDFLASLTERVRRRFVNGADAHVARGWAGLCVGTPDRRPLVGAVPGADRLLVLTGDNGFGLMRGLALGEVLVDALQGKTSALTEATSPGRFGARAPETFELREGFTLPD